MHIRTIYVFSLIKTYSITNLGGGQIHGKAIGFPKILADGSVLSRKGRTKHACSTYSEVIGPLHFCLIRRAVVAIRYG